MRACTRLIFLFVNVHHMLGTYDSAEEAAKAVAHYKLGELEAKGRLDKIERAPCGHVRAKRER